MSTKCPDSGIQVGSVLPKRTIYRLGLASDAHFIHTVATTFEAPFFYLNIPYSLLKLKLSVYFMNKIRVLANSNGFYFCLTFY